MKDYLVRATAGGGTIRAMAAATTELVEEARRRHDAWPTAAAALGRVLTAAALMGANLKGEDETLTLRITGDGPLGTIIAEADGAGRVRGYVKNPHVDLPANAQGKLDVGGAVGRDGHVRVIRDMGLAERYTGTSELISGEIGDDITHYLAKSEQTPSAVGLGVLVERDGTVRAAGGYILQLLPAASDEERQRLEENLQALGAVSRAIDAGMSAQDVLAAVLKGMDYHVLDGMDLGFVCRCSQERAIAIISSLGADEVRLMLEEDKGAELTCQFCGSVYQLSAEDLQAILDDLEARAAAQS